MHWISLVSGVACDNGKVRERKRRRSVRLEYAVAALDAADAKTELERRFLDLEVEHYTIEKTVEATTLQARMLKLPPSCVMLLA